MNRFVTRAGLGLVTVASLAIASVATAQHSGGGSGSQPAATPKAEPAKQAPKAEPAKPAAPATKAAEPAKPAMGADTVVAALSHDSKYTTLVGFIKAAGLDKTLSEKGPYTIFAPTNEAFAKLPKETVDSWSKPENKEALANLLKNHVASGKIMAADVKGMNGKTVNTMGKPQMVSEEGGSWKVGGAKITKADMAAGNGVIHEIDAVLTK
jgi:uncharacterized surface protein with fasciclin (FAS1) repeats